MKKSKKQKQDPRFVPRSPSKIKNSMVSITPDYSRRQLPIPQFRTPRWVGTHSTCVPDRAPTADSRGCPAFQPPIAADSCGSRSPISGPTGTYRHLSAAIGTKIKISHEHLGKIGKEMVNHLPKIKNSTGPRTQSNLIEPKKNNSVPPKSGKAGKQTVNPIPLTHAHISR